MKPTTNLTIKKCIQPIKTNLAEVDAVLVDLKEIGKLVDKLDETTAMRW